MRKLMPGYEPDTDTLTTSDTYLFGMDVTLARVKRGPLVAYLPMAALIDPWPEEFLWQPMKLLGVVDVWQSMHRSWSWPDMLDCVYQTADQWQFMQTVSRELIADSVAWQAYQKHQLRSYLCAYQDALDEGRVTVAAAPQPAL